MRSQELRSIPIELTGDFVSAECFIGLRLISAVVESAPSLAVALRWRPFQVDPELPPGGQDRAAYLNEKCGSPQNIRDWLDEQASAAREFGLDLAFEKIRRQPNTFDAHRLVGFARNSGVEMALVERLFRAFFLDGRDIGDRGVLTALAAGLGMDPWRVETFLDGTDGLEALRRELAEIRASGVEDVPRFNIAGKETITGIRSTEDFADALFAAIEDE